jgi:hypothetical protein
LIDIIRKQVKISIVHKLCVGGEKPYSQPHFPNKTTSVAEQTTTCNNLITLLLMKIGGEQTENEVVR